MKKLLMSLCLLTSLNVFGYAFESEDKYYIEKIKSSDKADEFYFHVGNNIWLTTPTVHKDRTGMYVFSCDIVGRVSTPRETSPKTRNNYSVERRWKCPYCYQFWLVGQKCQNTECPSKY